MRTTVVTYDNDSPLLCIGGPGFVASQGQFLKTRGILIANDASSLVGRDVDVLVSELSLGRWCVDGLGKSLAALQPRGLREAVNSLCLLIPRVR